MAIMEENIPGLNDLVDYFRSEGVKSCILYGSAAGGRLRTDSDIDLSTVAETDLSTAALPRHFLKADSLLKRSIDLRDLRRAKGLYLKEILTRGRILINDDPQFLGNKAIEMMDYQTDIAPQVNAIREQQLERMLDEE